ncbi:MAG: acyl-CoA/acyl-ACP dehydrogenase [Xanthobacteraceae bacterium]|nr:acyl-CoA/acyl-ACP dehydrogenase [Xanthobacteraceae bacterium]
MELLLNEQQVLLRDAAAKLGAVRGGPRRARQLRDERAGIDADAWKEIVAAGWLSALVSEDRGGLGLGAFDLALALEETGKQVVMTPLIEAAAAVWALAEAGADPDQAMQGKLIVPASGPPGQSYDGTTDGVRLDGGTLSGSLSFVPFADQAEAFVVTADEGAAAALCLVPRATKGLSIATTHNVDGSTSSRLVFDRAALPAGQVIAKGGKAEAIAAKTNELLLLGTAVELLGTAQAALDITLAYIKLREQFGKPIGSFQALQHRAVNCYVDAELNRSLIFAVLAAWDAGTCHPAMVAAAKARASRCALDTVRAALQLHGAIGYTDEHDIGIYYKRAVALAAKYGNEITHAGRFSELTMPVTSAAE